MTVRRRSIWPWLVVGAIVIVALWARVLTARYSSVGLPVLAKIPSFQLVDQTDTTFGSTDLKGNVWIASFIYTACPGPCPRVVERVAQVESRLGNEPRLRIVSFSVDPEIDTPQVLATYARLRGIDPQRWHLLTGPSEAVVNLIRTGFLLGLERSNAMRIDAQNPDGPVIHSTRLVLVDGDMRVRGYYETTESADVARLVDDTRRLLR